MWGRTRVNQRKSKCVCFGEKKIDSEIKENREKEEEGMKKNRITIKDAKYADKSGSERENAHLFLFAIVHTGNVRSAVASSEDKIRKKELVLF